MRRVSAYACMHVATIRSSLLSPPNVASWLAESVSQSVTLLAFPLELKLENCIKVLLDKRAQSKAGCEHRSRCVCIQLMKCLCAVRRTCAKIRSYWPRSKCRQNPAFARHVRVDPFADLPVPSSWLCGKPRRTLVSILEEKENTHKAKNNNFVPCVTS